MRIILADYHARPCWAFETLFDAQPEFEIIVEAVDGEGLISNAESISQILSSSITNCQVFK